MKMRVKSKPHIGETLKFRLKLTNFINISNILVKYQKNFYILSKPVFNIP